MKACKCLRRMPCKTPKGQKQEVEGARLAGHITKIMHDAVCR